MFEMDVIISQYCIENLPIGSSYFHTLPYLWREYNISLRVILVDRGELPEYN